MNRLTMTSKGATMKEENKELLNTIIEIIRNRTVEIRLIPECDFPAWAEGYIQCQNDILKLIEVLRGDD